MSLCEGINRLTIKEQEFIRYLLLKEVIEVKGKVSSLIDSILDKLESELAK